MKIVFGLTEIQFEKFRALISQTGRMFGQLDHVAMTLTFQGNLEQFDWAKQAGFCLVFGRRFKDYPEPLTYVPDEQNLSWMDLFYQTRSKNSLENQIKNNQKPCISNNFHCDADCSRCVASNSVSHSDGHIEINDHRQASNELENALNFL